MKPHVRQIFYTITTAAFLALGLAWPTGAQAASSGHSAFYFDASALFALANPTIVSGVDKPLLGIAGIGATLAKRLGAFGVGVTTDFRLVSQLNSVNSAVGNFSGSRWNSVSPTIMVSGPKLIVKLDFQFLGNFALSKKTAQGESVSYTSPLGGRLSMIFPNFRFLYPKKLRVGLFLEYLWYGKQKSSSWGELTLNPPQGVMQAGVTLSLGTL